MFSGNIPLCPQHILASRPRRRVSFGQQLHQNLFYLLKLKIVQSSKQHSKTFSRERCLIFCFTCYNREQNYSSLDVHCTPTFTSWPRLPLVWSTVTNRPESKIHLLPDMELSCMPSAGTLHHALNRDEVKYPKGVQQHLYRPKFPICPVCRAGADFTNWSVATQAQKKQPDVWSSSASVAKKGHNVNLSKYIYCPDPLVFCPSHSLKCMCVRRDSNRSQRQQQQKVEGSAPKVKGPFTAPPWKPASSSASTLPTSSLQLLPSSSFSTFMAFLCDLWPFLALCCMHQMQHPRIQSSYVIYGGYAWKGGTKGTPSSHGQKNKQTSKQNYFKNVLWPMDLIKCAFL